MQARRAGRLVLFVMVQLVLTLLLLEGVLRVARPHHHGLHSLLYLPTEQLDYERMSTLEELMEHSMLGFVPLRQRAGFVLNSHSFRTREYTPTPRREVARIVALGDSFTFGAEVRPNLTWTSVLERSLAAELPVSVEVLDLGVPGVGPRFEQRLWELEGASLQPHVVVLQFFVGNDFTDETSSRLVPWNDPGLVRASYGLRLARNLWRASRATKIRDTQPEELPGDPVLAQGGYAVEGTPPRRVRFAPAEFVRLEASRLELATHRHRAELDALATEAGTILERLASDVRASGADVLVMIVPDEYQVNADLRARCLDALGIAADQVTVEQPQRELVRRLEPLGIPYLDLLPEFRAAAATQRLYLPRNTHWSPAGHELAGRLVATALRERISARVRAPARRGQAARSRAGRTARRSVRAGESPDGGPRTAASDHRWRGSSRRPEPEKIRGFARRQRAARKRSAVCSTPKPYTTLRRKLIDDESSA